jgi:hypothetical protein
MASQATIAGFPGSFTQGRRHVYSGELGAETVCRALNTVGVKTQGYRGANTQVGEFCRLSSSSSSLERHERVYIIGKRARHLSRWSHESRAHG